MKKYIATILAFLVVFLCGCSAKNDDLQENITESNNEETEFTTDSTTVPDIEPVVGLQDLSTEKVVWGYGSVENHTQPSEPLSLNEKYNYLGANWLASGEKTVCLTFDEGYENGYTPSILDTLKEKGVSAIFFVTYDFAKDNPDLIKRMIDEGHIVGNHSYHHYTMDEISEDLAREEVTFLHNYIEENYNYTMSYFRFPKGEFSERALGIVNELGYKSVFWSYAYEDWDTDNQPNETKAFTNLCESTHDGEIILLHAVSETNAKILPKVIDDIQKQGYTFTTVL